MQAMQRHVLRLTGGCAPALLLALGALVAVRPAHAAQFDLQTATLEDINKAFDAGALTSEKLTQLYLKRIEAYDKSGPHINAVITLNAKALETARALDKERKAKGPRSKLHGVPVVLKDLYDTKDMPTSGGFLPLKSSQPILDATVVARLRDAGAIILAKVNMSDWFGVAKPGDQSTVLGRTNNRQPRPHSWRLQRRHGRVARGDICAGGPRQ
jgi:Asp-tRNA(Asn)/Glu-tRNA(Gln) amidotransferase A subunit family amidase